MVFVYVTLCGVIDTYQSFGGTSDFHVQIGNFGTYQTARRYSPVYLSVCPHGYENLLPPTSAVLSKHD